MRVGALVTLLMALAVGPPLIGRQIAQTNPQPITPPTSATRPVAPSGASAQSLTDYEEAQTRYEDAQTRKLDADRAIAVEQQSDKHATATMTAWLNVASSAVLSVLFPLLVLILIALSADSILKAIARGGWSLTIPGGISISLQQLTSAVANTLAQPPPIPMPISAVHKRLQNITQAEVDARPELRDVQVQASAAEAAYFKSVVATILPSQMQLLRRAGANNGSVDGDEARRIYANAGNAPLSFEKWLEYLGRFDLLDASFSGGKLTKVTITDVGAAFLKWCADNGYRLDALAGSSADGATA